MTISFLSREQRIDRVLELAVEYGRICRANGLVKERDEALAAIRRAIRQALADK